MLAGHHITENWHIAPTDLLGGLANSVSAMLGNNLNSAYCVALPRRRRGGSRRPDRISPSPSSQVPGL